MVLWDGDCLLHVLEGVGLEVLAGDAGCLGQAGNHVNRVETDGTGQDAFKIVGNEGVVGHFNQETYSHEWIVLDQQV